MDSLLIALLDNSGSMADGERRPEWHEWVRTRSAFAKPDEKQLWGKRAMYSTKTRATMDAFNHFLQVMKYRRDSCSFFMVKFDEGIQVTHKFVDLFTASPLNETTYNPNGSSTALYDSMVRVIDVAQDHIDSLPVDERPTQVTMLIQTDGGDNHSGLSCYQVVERMEEKRKQRWNFVFVGTGSIAADVGRDLGFKTGKDLVEYEDDGGLEAFAKAAEGVLESLITGNMEV